MSLWTVLFLVVFVIPWFGKMAEAAEYERDDRNDDGSWQPGDDERQAIREGKIT